MSPAIYPKLRPGFYYQPPGHGHRGPNPEPYVFRAHRDGERGYRPRGPMDAVPGGMRKDVTTSFLHIMSGYVQAVD